MTDNHTQTLKIAVCAGELSGDQQAAAVAAALLKKYNDIQITGMGGQNLKNAGARIIVDSERYGNLNGFNLVKIISLSLIAFSRMLRLLIGWKPHLLILVDYPDFNLRLAKFAKFLNIPVLYFIPPKVWAWRPARIKALKKSTDQLALIFPFEKDFYTEHNIDRAEFVGHPLAEELDYELTTLEEKQNFLRSLDLDPEKPVLAFFPGSRQSEIKRHLPVMIPALEKIKEHQPELQVILALAPSLKKKKVSKLLPDHDWIKTCHEDTQKVLKYSDAGLLKSGTCNLEAAFYKLPFVCFYTAPRMTELLVKKFIQIDCISPVNIIRKETITELICDEVTPENCQREVEKVLFNTPLRQDMQSHLKEVADSMIAPEEDGQPGSGERVARLAFEMAEKKKRTGNIYSRTFAFLKPYKKQFMGAMGCMIIFGASDGTIPFLVKHILDGIFQDKDKLTLKVLPFALILFTLLRAGAEFGQRFLMSRIGLNMVKDIRNQANSHLLKLSPGYFKVNSSGNILARFTSDVLLLKDTLTNSVSAIIRDTVRIIALLIAAVYLDPFLAMIAFLAFPIGMLPVYKFGRKMRKLSKKGQDAVGNLSGLLQETITGNKVVRIFGREKYEAQRFEEENRKLNETFIKSEKIRAITGPINEIVASLAISGVILYGGYSVIHGIRSQGDFIAFLLAVFLLYDPFKKLSRINNSVQQGVSGAERIFELLDTIPDIQDPPCPEKMGTVNSIELENVTFSYESADRPAVQDINLTVAENQRVALVGFSGAGKTTLIDLIPRFMDPEKGTVKVAGRNVKNLSIQDLRSKIAMVGQHTFLFNDTIHNNIAYGNPEATEEDVIAAAKAAYAYDFITAMPEGFNSIVGESGLTLSGGERQRLAIARAILKDAPILILDEATASLDNKAERYVQAALEALEKDRTSLVIAHRLSTVISADLIVVLEDGKIMETGTHQDLLDKGGMYSRLYKLQFSNENESE